MMHRAGIIKGICVAAIVGAGMIAHSAAAKEVLLDGVAARVDDRTILVSDVQKIIAPIYAKLRSTVKSNKELEEYLKDAYTDALKLLIDREVILARHENPNPEGIKLMVQERLQEMIRGQFDGDRNAFIAALSKERLTMWDWKSDLRDKIVVSVIQQREIGGYVTVSPSSVWKAYRENIDEFKQSEKVHLRMIVLQKGVSDSDTTLKKEQARSLRSRIVAGGDFAALARSFSEDIKKGKGGDWGWLETSALNPEITAAIADLEVGDVSELVEDDNSLYLLKLEGRREATTIPIQEAWEAIVRELEKQEYDRLYDIWIEKLRKKSYVVVFDL